MVLARRISMGNNNNPPPLYNMTAWEECSKLYSNGADMYRSIDSMLRYNGSSVLGHRRCGYLHQAKPVSRENRVHHRHHLHGKQYFEDYEDDDGDRICCDAVESN